MGKLGWVIVVLGLAGCGGSPPAGDGGAKAPRDGAPQGSDGGGPAPDGGAIACAPLSQRMGQATYYTTADGSGNCSFPATPSDLMVAALNDPDYDNAAWCGACAHVTGPMGSVTLRIVDRCPGCASGDLDLSPQAFDVIANRADGRVPITWRFVPCAVSGPIVYHFKSGSNQWWTAVQIRNSRNAITKLEAKVGGEWQAIGRLQYNYFVAASGLGPGPYTFRVTDVYGNQLVDRGVPSLDGADAPGAAQFPVCR